MSNMIFLCELTIVIPRLPCLFRMAGAVTAQGGTTVIGNNRVKIRRVWKELCYGKAETLKDAEEMMR